MRCLLGRGCIREVGYIKEKGSALLTSVISILVLILISSVLFTVALSHIKVETSEEKGLIAYHMAEAGIQYGIAEALHQGLDKDNPTLNIEIDDPFGYDGKIEISVDLNTEDYVDSIIVSSKATYNGIIREKKAEYLYEMEEDESDTEGDAGEGEEEESDVNGE